MAFNLRNRCFVNEIDIEPRELLFFVELAHVAAFDQGARVTYLDPTGSQPGHKESIADTACVLGRPSTISTPPSGGRSWSTP